MNTGFCVERGKQVVVELDKCSNPVWMHRYEVPGKCRKTFHYTAKPHPLIVFPVGTGSGVYRFCIEIIENRVESYSSQQLKNVLGEVSEIVADAMPDDPVDVLQGIYKGLIAHYHEELSSLDGEIEKSIDALLRKGSMPIPIYRLYSRASRLHRGVHGVIYSLHRLERIYPDLKDLGDEAVMLENMYSTSIDRIAQAFTLYFTLISDKTNKIVTKLTVISAIFLPLTLIAGIYGMNFKYMPELENPYAYPAVLLAMAAIAIGELAYFKRKKWI